MDAQSSVAEAVTLAAFVRALVSFLQATRGSGEASRPCHALPWWAQKDNCFNASRAAMAAPFILDQTGATRELRALLQETLGKVAEFAHDEFESRVLGQLSRVIDYPPCQRQLDLGRRGSLKGVVRALADTLAEELASPVSP